MGHVWGRYRHGHPRVPHGAILRVSVVIYPLGLDVYVGSKNSVIRLSADSQLTLEPFCPVNPFWYLTTLHIETPLNLNGSDLLPCIHTYRSLPFVIDNCPPW